MSAPLAGKFQDHYITLGIDPGADTETIQIAYLKLIEKYGPDNGETANPEKLEIINGAYETLSDPQLRKEFDKVKGVTGDRGSPMFAGVQFFEILGQQVGLRGAILSVLYDRRRTRPSTPALSMRQLENMLEADIEAMNFALWYLKQRNFVANDDKSSLQISAAGMDFLETKRPDPEEVMPFIKLSAIVGFQKPKAVAATPAAAVEEAEDMELEAELEAELEPEPVLSVAQPVTQPIVEPSAQPTTQPSARSVGKLDGNAIRGMATRGFPRR
jgi:curved DNA-binding protein CbpA